MPAVKKELAGREDLALALAAFHPALAALPLPPLPGYLAPLPAVAALPPAASLPATAAGYEGLLAPPLRAPRAYLSLDAAAPHLHLPRDPLALERFSAPAAAAPDFQPLLDNGEPCIEVECGANRALLYVRKLCQGSKGPSIRHRGEWLTPNEFQFVSGRETAKDWKRSIRHKGAPAAGPSLTSAPRGSAGRDPTPPPSGETPSPPGEGAMTPGLPRGQPAPHPHPALHGLLCGPGRASSASTVRPAPAARCQLLLALRGSPQGCGASGRSAGEVTETRESRREAGWAGDPGATGPGGRGGHTCGRGVGGYELLGRRARRRVGVGAAGPRVGSGARAEQERRRSGEQPVGLLHESGSSSA